MKQSRRRFLLNCGASAISILAVTPFSIAEGLNNNRKLTPTHQKRIITLLDVNRANFEPLLHSSFEVSDEGQNPIKMELTEVKEDLSNSRLEQLSLLFRGPKQPILPQKIYTFRHDAVGELGFFIVPVGQENNGTIYQAIFNRLR